MRKILTFTAVVGLLVSTAGAAPLTNGSFESGLTGWQVWPSTTYVAAVTSHPLAAALWTPTDGSYFARITTDGQGVVVNIKQDFTVDQPGNLCFDYFFDHSYGSVRVVKAAGNVNTDVLFSTFGDSPDGVWTPVSFALAPGNYTVVFGAVSMDATKVGYLGIDHVRICTGNGYVIPEPLTMLAVFSGVAGLAGYIRKRMA